MNNSHTAWCLLTVQQDKVERKAATKLRSIKNASEYQQARFAVCHSTRRQPLHTRLHKQPLQGRQPHENMLSLLIHIAGVLPSQESKQTHTRLEFRLRGAAKPKIHPQVRLTICAEGRAQCTQMQGAPPAPLLQCTWPATASGLLQQQRLHQQTLSTLRCSLLLPQQYLAAAGWPPAPPHSPL